MSDESLYARMARLSAIITILPASMAAGWLVGYFLADHFLGSYPIGSILGTMLGAGAGFYEIVSILLRDQRDGRGRGNQPGH